MRQITTTLALAAVSVALLTGCAGSTEPVAASTTEAAIPTPASATAAPSQSPADTPITTAAPGPTFTFPGDPQCAITYRDRGDGSMTWTATTTVAGELITHAFDGDGNIYRHDVQVTAGPNAFAAPVPLAKINDIGGSLTGADGTSYGCSVKPAA
jgi:hypothetical protein